MNFQNGKMVVQNISDADAIRTSLLPHIGKLCRVEFGYGLSRVLVTYILNVFNSVTATNNNILTIGASHPIGSSSINYNDMHGITFIFNP